jgi:3-dehydroquinate dehydratase I
MICVSIAEPTVETALEALEGIDFAEIRIDRMSIGEEGIMTIFASGHRLVATCRPGNVPEAARKRLLLAAVEAGAAYVDVEIESEEGFRAAVVGAAKLAGCRVIVSHHDFAKTPSRGELREIVDRCFEAGADVAKIACRVGSDGDNARLLGLLDDARPVVVMGLGTLGAKTRFMAPLLGAPFVYASRGRGLETAEGQIEHRKLDALIQTLRGI